MAIATFLPVIGRHAVAVSLLDSIDQVRYACAPGTPVFAVLDGSISFTDEGITIKSLKGRLVVTYVGVDRAESELRQADVLAAGQFIGRVAGSTSGAGLAVTANLGDEIHDMATLLADAEDPVVMWPRGAPSLIRPSSPKNPLPQPDESAADIPTEPATDQVEPAQTNSRTPSIADREAGAPLESNVELVTSADEVESPPQPESTPHPALPSEPELPPIPAPPPEPPESGETSETDSPPNVPGHRLAARRSRPSLGTRRKGR